MSITLMKCHLQDKIFNLTTSKYNEKLNEENSVTLEDLYKLKDKDIIEIIKDSKYQKYAKLLKSKQKKFIIQY